MFEVLYFSDRRVRDRLFDRVASTGGLLLIAGILQPKGCAPIEQREPFASLERRFGEVLAICVVADEGTAEGMWRDPLGDLGDMLFPEDREKAYAAAQHYVVLEQGRPLRIVKKSGHPATDLHTLQTALSELDASIPRPPPASAKTGGAREAEAGGRREQRGSRKEEPRARREVPAAVAPVADPWALLGISPQSSRADARKAFRALVAQYHPDKVAHLAPEFRELADLRTRALLVAWETVEPMLR